MNDPRPHLLHFLVKQIQDVLFLFLSPVTFHMVVPGAPAHCWVQLIRYSYTTPILVAGVGFCTLTVTIQRELMRQKPFISGVNSGAI